MRVGSNAQPRRAPRVPAVVLTIVLGLALATALASSRAHAGTINVWGCHQLNGAVAPLDRWTSYVNAAFIDNWNTCAADGAGAFGTTVAANWHPGYSYGSWTFTAPANTTVVGFTYDRSGIVREGASLNIFNGTAPIYDSVHLEELCQTPSGCGGFSFARVNVGPVPDANGFMFLTSACYLAGGCDANSNGTFTVKMTIVELSDLVPPAFSGVSGSLAGSGPLSGSASLNFLASDAGTGVYRLHATVDGVPFDDRIIDANGGACAPTPGPRDFLYAVPCKLNTSVGSTLNTATLPDGAHDVVVRIEDAAGNLTTVLNNEITTRNAPSSTGPPTVSGTPRVGERQTGTTGTWSPAGASYRYQWLRCSASITSSSQAGSCTAIVGATASQYDATTFDAYQRLMIRVTAINAGGTATATSQPTEVVTDAQGNATPPSGDADGDGLSDSSDGCPTAPGPASSNGCPEQSSPAPLAPALPIVRSRDDGALVCNPVCGGSYRDAVIVGSSKTRRSRFGQGFAMAVALRLPNGKPISGATLQVIERINRPGAKEVVAGTMKTDSRGNATWRAKSRLLPSATYSAVYRSELAPGVASANPATYDAQFRTVHVVTSRVAFSVSPRRARNGSIMSLRGQVKASLFPKRGVGIRFEAQRAGGKGAGRAKWTQFHALRTNRAGAFSGRYQLRGKNLAARLTMRACADPDGSWPYQASCSRSFSIRTR